MRSFKLIRGTKEEQATETAPQPSYALRAAILAGICFFLLKLPMCFVSNNPEELRDYDHYSMTARGELPYRDYVWLYGPLCPLVYGAILKIFPDTLLTVRLFTHLLWSLAAFLIFQFLGRYVKNLPGRALGIVFCTGIFGYPAYSHNHPLMALCALGCAFSLVRYLEDQEEKDFFISFGCLLAVFFGRPILMGYGMALAWGALVLFHPKVQSRWRLLSLCVGFTTVALFLSLILYGAGTLSAFYPKPWAVLEAKAYPNLHHLVIRLAGGGIEVFRSLRAALETGVFYSHYFIWPAVILTLWGTFRFHPHVQAAAICAILGWAASLDLLHYGFPLPKNEPAMTVRGQFFFALTAVSIFLVGFPKYLTLPTRKARALCLSVFITFLGWQYIPYLTGFASIVRFSSNAFGFRALTGVRTHTDRYGVFEAVQFINSLCKPNDTVVIPQYDPGLRKLLKCGDLFAKDAYMFTRHPWYMLSARETPYAPLGEITNEAAIEARITAKAPRFYLMDFGSAYRKKCLAPGWKIKDFGKANNGRQVCYHE